MPKLRFRGFNAQWISKLIGELSPVRGGYAFKSENYGSNGVPIVRISNILPTGKIGGSFVYTDIKDVEYKFSLSKGDILIAMSGATTGKISYIDTNQVYYQNQRVGFFTRSRNINNEFLKAYLSTKFFKNQLDSVLATGAQPNISSNQIDNFLISIPELNEQIKIGAFLSAIDRLIEKQMEKVELIKQAQNFYLNKVFPYKNKKVPEIRFNGFQGDWKKQSLGDSVFLNRFSQLSAGEVEELNTFKGDVKLLPSSRNYDWFCDSINVDKSIVCIGEVITVGRARNANTKYTSGKFISSQNHIIETFDSSILNTKFLYYFITMNDKKFYSSETAYPIFTKQDFDEIQIHFPSLDEQKKLTHLFNKFEELSTKESRKLESYKLVKQHYLQKLFADQEGNS